MSGSKAYILAHGGGPAAWAVGKMAPHLVREGRWPPHRTRPRRARPRNNQPAFGYYIQGPLAAVAHGLIVLTRAGDEISAITGFGDYSTLIYFGLPGPARLAR